MASRLAEIADRDGGLCLWCGRAPWPSDRSLEHICPRSRGGAGESANLALACRRCNRDRRSRSVASFARERLLAGEQPDFERIEAAMDELRDSPRRAHRSYAQTELRHLPAARAALG